MPVYTKTPEEVFDPVDGSGNARGANMEEVRTLLAEIVEAINDAIAGVRWNVEGADAATTAALPANTYANGTLGVGATLTGNANGALADQDGVAMSVGSRLLVKDEASQLKNGLYSVTQVGDGSNPYILTRATDADTAADLDRIGITVLDGDTQVDFQYLLQLEADEITVGTTSLVFGLFSNQAGLSLKADKATTISTTGLLTGGGTLAGDKTFDVPIASEAEAEAALSNLVAMTPLRTGEYVDSKKGAANGLASLDATGKLSAAQIPAALTAGLIYQGTWNANTNSPTITSSVGTAGHYYKVSVAGSTSIDGVNSWAVGDSIIFSGSVWQKVVAFETGVLASLSVSAGSAVAPAISIEQATTGFAQLFDHTISVITDQEFESNAENHGYPTFTRRGSLLLGSRSDDGENRLPNQSALEIVIQNNAEGAAVPATFFQNAPDSASVEPIIMARGRADSIGGTEVAVQAGDSAFTIQGQVTDGLGTDNVAIGNFGMRVQSGTVPIPGSVLGYAGNAFISLASGDGVSSIRTVMEWQSDGDVNAVVGSIRMNNTEVINQSRQVFATGIRNTRAAIADDGIYTYPVAGGATAIIHFITTSTPAVTFPCGSFAARVSSATTAVALALNAGAEVEFKSGGGIISDHTTCTDGKLTISPGGDGNVYVVNRLGGSRTFAWSTTLYNA